VPDLVGYGAARNVGIILWYGWLSGSGEQANQARLTQCQSWGVKGVKVDFTGSDNEDAMKFYDYFTRDAIGRKQMVLWHGTTLPRGQERRLVSGRHQCSESAAHRGPLDIFHCRPRLSDERLRRLGMGFDPGAAADLDGGLGY